MDLGTFSRPLLLFGGPYSNLDATLALKQRATDLGIAPDHIICSGDIVAYCGQPAETSDLIREWGIHVLMGNCEESFANNADDCGCGFEKGSSCDLLSAGWVEYVNTQLNSEHRQWFAGLARELRFKFEGKKVQVVHGSATSINQFLFASSAAAQFEEQFNATAADIIIAGHSGLPFSKHIGDKLWHNTGAIGLPANDGTARTWYSVLSGDGERIKIESQALDYDHQQAARQMQTAGLNDAYSQALLNGLWPSMDVLPRREQLQRGMALCPCSVSIDS